MRSFIKKDLLLFWRDRKELITILVLPIVLVVILNFAFAGLFGNDEEPSMDLHVAIVNQDDETKSMAQLKEKLIEDASLGEAEAEDLVAKASQISPVPMLFDYLNSDELKELVTVHKLGEEEAIAKVEEGDLDGILVIPDGFTVDSLYAAFVGESPTTSLKYKMEKETTNNSTLYQIIQGFTEQLNYQFALQELAGSMQMEVTLPEGGFEKVGSGESFTLTQYFTIAMGALFTLFLAATVATKAGVEVRQQVFHRILLTNSNPMLFLIGKMVSTFCLVWLQVMFVFILSHFLLDVFPGRSVTFWSGAVGMIALLSLAIAGLAAVFTSILLRMSNIDAANGIFMMVILLFGVIGGNFVPIYILPNWLQQIGEWTPNGLFLVILTDWVQVEDFSSIVRPSLILIGFFLLCTVVSFILYPKRGKA
ncbi:ABC transporter permease [Radiobacillus kanasensis]|uniref:ABC transporter permease n=1 Tax=Radiobacillus kanasensis TaxID=2844358 RepID=UPI001E43504A|nr:ABC transporter permease [Radiobacillus kanasensis]UFU00231.1 ABC transporter permease [Radiobacillus kanasensis]